VRFTDYRPYCPYTVDPDPAGTWTAPDMGRAEDLVAASGTEGMDVEVWETAAFERVGRYFVSVLDDLGYRARLRVIGDPDEFFGFVLDPSNDLQAGGFTWLLPNRGSPHEFISLLSCGDMSDPSRFCDPSIDRLVERARRVQITDPAAAGPLWAEIDRDLVDQAPWVATITPGWVDVVSERLGNYQPHPVWGMLPDLVWVR
jgi:peptide/nickel transport system substrate-binding protein